MYLLHACVIYEDICVSDLQAQEWEPKFVCDSKIPIQLKETYTVHCMIADTDYSESVAKPSAHRMIIDSDSSKELSEALTTL